MREVVASGEASSSNCDLAAQAKKSMSVILTMSDKSNKIFSLPRRKLCRSNLPDRVSSFGLVVGLAVDALGMAM